MRARVALVLVGALAVLMAFTYRSWKPLLIGFGVQEPFPGLSEAENTVFQTLPPAQREAYLNLLVRDAEGAIALLRAALQPDIAVSPEQQALPSMQAETIIAYGEFIGLDAVRWASGDFILYQDADDTKLLRLENFRSAPGPNLHVILAKAPPADEDGMIMSDQWADWELREPYLDLGPLLGNWGDQNFPIAPELDWRQYSMVIIYSVSHNLLISAAPLS